MKKRVLPFLALPVTCAGIDAVSCSNLLASEADDGRSRRGYRVNDYLCGDKNVSSPLGPLGPLGGESGGAQPRADQPHPCRCQRVPGLPGHGLRAHAEPR